MQTIATQWQRHYRSSVFSRGLRFTLHVVAIPFLALWIFWPLIDTLSEATPGVRASVGILCCLLLVPFHMPAALKVLAPACLLEGQVVGKRTWDDVREAGGQAYTVTLHVLQVDVRSAWELTARGAVEAPGV